MGPPPRSQPGDFPPIELPIPKKPKLSLKKKQAEERISQFVSPKKQTEERSSRFVSLKKDFDQYQKGFVPKNTEVNTFWAVRNFNDWLKAYNMQHPECACPEDILLTDNLDSLSVASKVYPWHEKEKWREISTQNFIPTFVWAQLAHEGKEC